MRIVGPTETRPLLPTEGSVDGAAMPGTPAPQDISFEDIFAQTIGQANQADRTAAAKVDALARGASDDLHGTMISVKEAEISMKLVGTIRNKLLDAFHEIWRTSV